MIKSWEKARKVDLRLQTFELCNDIVESKDNVDDGMLLAMGIGCMDEKSKVQFLKKLKKLEKDTSSYEA